MSEQAPLLTSERADEIIEAVTGFLKRHEGKPVLVLMSSRAGMRQTTDPVQSDWRTYEPNGCQSLTLEFEVYPPFRTDVDENGAPRRDAMAREDAWIARKTAERRDDA